MEVLAIEQAHSGSSAWTEEDFLLCLRQRNCIGMVAEQGEKIVGFMLYNLHSKRLEILNFAVHPDHLRQGIASRMIAKLQSKLSSHRRNSIKIEVPETALSMQLFLRSYGIPCVKMIRGKDEDAYLFQYTIPSGIFNADGDEVAFPDDWQSVNRCAQYMKGSAND